MSQVSDDRSHTVAIRVVEDDDAAGELIGTVLKDVDGWTATVASDAALARSAFQQVKIDVLLLDINLPGITGLELLALLRDEPAWTDPAVILMSADEHQPGIRETLADGRASAFLAKPLDLDQPVETIRQAIEP